MTSFSSRLDSEISNHIQELTSLIEDTHPKNENDQDRQYRYARMETDISSEIRGMARRLSDEEIRKLMYGELDESKCDKIYNNMYFTYSSPQDRRERMKKILSIIIPLLRNAFELDKCKESIYIHNNVIINLNRCCLIEKGQMSYRVSPRPKDRTYALRFWFKLGADSSSHEIPYDTEKELDDAFSIVMNMMSQSVYPHSRR